MVRLTRELCPLAVATALVGCAHQTVHAAAAPARLTCDDTVAATDRQIAAHIYGQGTEGRDAAGAQARVTHSAALAEAVARGDAAATRAALRPLLRARIQRIVVTRGDHTLAELGHRTAIAPVTGAIRAADGRPVGRFRLSLTAAPGLAALISDLTATQVTISSGATVLARAGTTPSPVGEHVVVPGRAFSSAPLRIRLATPASGRSSCSTTDVIGAVGKRLYQQERTGSRARRVLRIVTGDARFERAVAEDDPGLLRARIVHFFRDPSLHVVRIRAVTSAGRLVNDVGGPYVLAPASAPVRRHGRVVGTVTLSIQDDAGYIKLMRRFTGASTVLRAGGTVVPGSARPGGAGPAITFRVLRFPSGPLTVTLVPGHSIG